MAYKQKGFPAHSGVSPAKNLDEERQNAKDKINVDLGVKEAKPDLSHVTRGDEDESGGPKKNPFKPKKAKGLY